MNKVIVGIGMGIITVSTVVGQVILSRRYKRFLDECLNIETSEKEIDAEVEENDKEEK